MRAGASGEGDWRGVDVNERACALKARALRATHVAALDVAVRDAVSVQEFEAEQQLARVDARQRLV